MKTTLLLLPVLLGAALASAQPQSLDLSRLEASSVSVAAAKIKGHDVVRVEKDPRVTLCIEVRGQLARLFLNDNPQPSLILNDRKRGADARGGVGLWVDVGTGDFSEI